MNKFLIKSIEEVPAVIPYLKGKARWVAFTLCGYKTQPYFQGTIEHLVQQVYSGNMGGDFIDIMANLIQGQLTDAYTQAWNDDGNTTEIPDYLQKALEDAILGQYDFVDQFYRDIVDAKIDGTPIDPLLSRADLWANRWTEAYNDAVRLINVNTGGKLMWKEGDTEKKCDTCVQLDGIVAYASTWEELGVHPQGGPNDKLQCNGYRCGCSLESTDQRQSPNAYDTILNIVMSTQ